MEIFDEDEKTFVVFYTGFGFFIRRGNIQSRTTVQSSFTLNGTACQLE
jgi:hypothetical protein